MRENSEYFPRVDSTYLISWALLPAGFVNKVIFLGSHLLITSCWECELILLINSDCWCWIIKISGKECRVVSWELFLTEECVIQSDRKSNREKSLWNVSVFPPPRSYPNLRIIVKDCRGNMLQLTATASIASFQIVRYFKTPHYWFFLSTHWITIY